MFLAIIGKTTSGNTVQILHQNVREAIISDCPALSLVNCATVNNGEFGFCNCNTCSENEGDCDSNDECLDDLFCGSNNCPASLSFDSEVDCCNSKQTELMSPNYPYLYPSNAQETWLITASTGSTITLQFHFFKVGSYPTPSANNEPQLSKKD